MTKALIVVDVQKDFCEGGSLAVAGGKQVADDINHYTTHNGEHYTALVATLDYHLPEGTNGGHFADEPDFVDSWPRHCVQGTMGASFEEPLQASQFLEVFTKGAGRPSYSGFEGTGLVTSHSMTQFLRENGVTEVDVVGLALDYCVKATALSAVSEGFRTRVLLPLTASVAPANMPEVIEELETFNVTVLTELPARA